MLYLTACRKGFVSVKNDYEIELFFLIFLDLVSHLLFLAGKVLFSVIIIETI